MIRRLAPALIVFGAGLIVLAVAQAATPGRGLPLYDGVVVEDPYLYIPPEPGQSGPPAQTQAQLQVSGDSSPAVVVVTGESPPQAQLILAAGALDMPVGTTSLTGSATPLAATPDQLKSSLLSNVYQLSVVDQDGHDVPLAAGQLATIVLRSSNLHLAAQTARWDGTTWHTVPTAASGQSDLFKAQADTLGEYVLLPGQALIEPGAAFVLGIAILVVAVFGVVFLRRRSASAASAAKPATKNRRNSR